MAHSLRPEHEEDRLRVLSSLGLLDTPKEERYDRITRKLAEVLQVPIAYLALIDANRQWLKSAVGELQCELDRDASFCAHTIYAGQPLIIPDTRADPRFADHPLVVGDPFIRFYAGYPLQAGGAVGVGTLCVADREPRQPSPMDLQLVEAYARLVEQILNKAPNVFISYSHLDEDWKDRVVRHLSVLGGQQLIDVWDDRKIRAGECWRGEIEEAVEAANVAILLISAHFLTSDFIMNVEVPRLLDRRDQEGLLVVPLIIKPCSWNQVQWLERMNMYPKDAQPLSGKEEYQTDQLLADLAGIVLERSRAALKATAPAVQPGQILGLAPVPAAAAEQTVSSPAAPAKAPTAPAGPEPEGTAVKLTVTPGEPEAAPESYLFRQTAITIGRHPGCDLPLPDPKRIVSSRHAAIARREGGFLVTDLGSKNFTLLGGERLEPDEPRELHPGDELQIGEFTLQFELLDEGAEPEEELTENSTLFGPDFVNPFAEDAQALAGILRRIRASYDAEARGRRDDALREALEVALGEDRRHPAHAELGRLLESE